jgi:hypothetical protein
MQSKDRGFEKMSNIAIHKFLKWAQRKKKSKRPILLKFEIPPLWKNNILLDFDKNKVFIEFVLNENDELTAGRFVLVCKDKPRIRREFNTETKTLKIIKTEK